MKKPWTLTVIDPDVDASVVHIANAPDIGAGAPQTLCGFTDMPGYVQFEPGERPPTCSVCLKIVRYCKNLKI